MRIISESKLKARKNYSCDGCWQIERHVDPYYKDHEAFKQYQECKGIKKGVKYFKQTQVSGGEIQDFKSCVDCWEVIGKYNFYEND